MSSADAQNLYLHSVLGKSNCNSCFLYQPLSSLVTVNMLQFFQYKFDSNWQPGFMFTCVLNQESRGFGGGQCVFISHLLGEKKVSDICGGNARRKEPLGGFWVHHSYFFYLSSCGFMQREAVSPCPFASSWWWEESLWCFLLPTLVSRIWNISTWEIHSGTTSGPSWGPWAPRAAVGV